MTIINAVKETISGVELNTLTYHQYFWVTVYDQTTKIIRYVLPVDQPVNGGNKIHSKLWGFASDDYNFMLKEIEKRGLIYPS